MIWNPDMSGLRMIDKKEVGLKMVWVTNGIWNLEAGPFEILTNGCHFVKNNLKSGQKHPDFQRFYFQMVKTVAVALGRPFENLTIGNSIFVKSGIGMLSGFERSDFRQIYKHDPEKASCVQYSGPVFFIFALGLPTPYVRKRRVWKWIVHATKQKIVRRCFRKFAQSTAA